MASQTNLQLLLSKGPLSSLWENKTLKTEININNGQIYVGFGNDNRAMLFIDESGKRYPVMADVKWNDIKDIPTDIVYNSKLTETTTSLINQINSKVSIAGDTMTGPLSIAQDNSATGILKKVTLDYNEKTESLDFTFV